MKKKIVLILCLLICLCIGGTYAYFTHLQKLRNEFTVGNNTIEIIEEYNPPEEIGIGETEFKKEIKIKNTGNTAAYIRLFVEFSDSDIKKISEISVDGTTYFPADKLNENLPQNWTIIEENGLDQYYYYTEILEPGEISEPIFKKIRISADEETINLVNDFDIIVYAESIQIKDIDGNVFQSDESYKEAWIEFLKGGNYE